jgi:hypothetical protein
MHLDIGRSRQKVFDLLRLVSRHVVNDDIDLPPFLLMGNNVDQESHKLGRSL